VVFSVYVGHTWKGHVKEASFKQRTGRAVCSRATIATLLHVSVLAVLYCDLKCSIFGLRKYK